MTNSIAESPANAPTSVRRGAFRRFHNHRAFKRLGRKIFPDYAVVSAWFLCENIE
jgi:hypothetical protein